MEICERICAAWDALPRELAARDENALLVTHGGVLQVILSIVRREAHSNAMSPRKDDMRSGSRGKTGGQNGGSAPPFSETRTVRACGRRPDTAPGSAHRPF